MIREEERIKGGGKWVLEQVCDFGRERDIEGIKRERKRDRGEERVKG